MTWSTARQLNGATNPYNEPVCRLAHRVAIPLFLCPGIGAALLGNERPRINRGWPSAHSPVHGPQPWCRNMLKGPGLTAEITHLLTRRWQLQQLTQIASRFHKASEVQTPHLTDQQDTQTPARIRRPLSGPPTGIIWEQYRIWVILGLPIKASWLLSHISLFTEFSS